MVVSPQRSAAARPSKKLSQSQPARSRDGQSVKRSTAFCRKVWRAASKMRLRSQSEESNDARKQSGLPYSRRETERTEQAVPHVATLR